MFQRILVPTDGSELTAKAIRTVVSLAGALKVPVEVLSVKQPYADAPMADGISVTSPLPQDFLDAQERMAAQRVKLALDDFQAAGIECRGYTVEAVHPWEAIVDHAQRQGCDLIVMASHGRSGVSALLLGSETQKVLTHTQVPVLVVR